jgi:hypothetical protein
MIERRRVVGVDFSGAVDAGRRIWVAEGRLRDGLVDLERCLPATALPDGAVEREPAHAALVAYVARQTDAVVGLDLPFSLPRALIAHASWAEFILDYGARHASAQAFRSAMVAISGGRELKRRTDVETRVPFAAVNVRMFRQVHYGVGAVIAPLVRADAARAIPLQVPVDGKPVLAEICPASLLKHLGLYRPYKGNSPAHRRGRRDIVAALIDRRIVAPPARRFVLGLLADSGGDALDAVLAAVAAARTARLDPSPRDDLEAFEGRVYF